MPSTADIGSLDVIYGITANNNPTVRTSGTPRRRGLSLCGLDAWSTPSASTMIEGAFAAHVGGVGAYTMINDMLYLEADRLQDAGVRAAEFAGHRSVRCPRPVRAVSRLIGAWRLNRIGVRTPSCSAPSA